MAFTIVAPPEQQRGRTDPTRRVGARLLTIKGGLICESAVVWRAGPRETPAGGRVFDTGHCHWRSCSSTLEMWDLPCAGGAPTVSGSGRRVLAGPRCENSSKALLSGKKEYNKNES